MGIESKDNLVKDYEKGGIVICNKQGEHQGSFSSGVSLNNKVGEVLS